MSLDGAKLASGGRAGSGKQVQEDTRIVKRFLEQQQPAPGLYRRFFRTAAVGRLSFALAMSDSSRPTHERTVGSCEAEIRAINAKLKSGCNASSLGLRSRCRMGACLEMGQLAYTLRGSRK